MTKKQLQDLISSSTEWVLSTITDIALTQLFFFFLLPGRRSPYDIHKAGDEAYQLVSNHINYQSIKRAIYQLTKRGLVTRSKGRSTLEIQITKEGKQKIAALIPEYRSERAWDGHIYLISYDIPKQANYARDLIREYIRRTGGAMLQESLWMNPYNPQNDLEEYADQHQITGTILISKLGTDGAIGRESLNELIERVYNLKGLSQRYEAFIAGYTLKGASFSVWKCTMEYMTILKDDPQLPFALEPKDFPAHRANMLYRRLTGHQK